LPFNVRFRTKGLKEKLFAIDQTNAFAEALKQGSQASDAQRPLLACNGVCEFVEHPILLVVEDEALLMMVAEESLEEAGYQVIAASSGEEAIALLEARHAEIRGLVTDVHLGTLSGWDVARRGRELVPDLPVVYVSGGHVHEWTSQGVPQSVMIQKPYALAQLVTAISQLINAHPAPPPQ
jgi:CheY-like chemotaxis protein